MFHPVLTTCFAGVLCHGEPDVGYATVERCLEEGAILAGLARAHLNLDRMQQAPRIMCAAEDGAKITIYTRHAQLPPQQFP
jgi:hypothetical protein